MTIKKPVPGLCDRCGQRYRLRQLKEEYILGKPTGLFTCPSCYEVSHPQLDTRFVKTDDKQTVMGARSDWVEREASRALYAWNPVGCEATGVVDVSVGLVRVVT